jgi:glycosyltransferase involved in cell wall biosynthesis
VTTVAIVVPCYNEEAVLPETSRRLREQLQALRSEGLAADDSAIYFVDDGSSDKTWALVEQLAGENREVHGIKLSRNRGHQNALIAGMFNAAGDVVISVDADLQDDLNAMNDMLRAYRSGSDVVYGVRRKRDTDGAFKRSSALGYYRMLSLLGVDVVHNHADYRLLSRRVIEALREYGESNLFLRGIIPQLGFNSAIVHYDRARRFAGESKYPLRRMIAFALQGVTSFSAAPLRAITLLGMLVALVSIGGGMWVLFERFWNAKVVPGWASTVLPIFFLGGVQMLCLGVIGEYVAKIYMETKRRPRYIIDRQV